MNTDENTPGDQTPALPEKKRSRKPVGTIVYYGILGLLVLTALLFVVNKLNNRVTFIFGRAAVLIMTESMEPEIPAMSYILLRKAEADEVKVGDVITFYSDDPAIGGRMNTHRVTGITGGESGIEFQTMGDNNLVGDSYTAKGDKVIGIYEKRLPVISAASRLFFTGTGLIMLFVAFGIFTAAMLTPEILKVRRDAQAARQAERELRIAEEVERLKAEAASKDAADAPENSADAVPCDTPENSADTVPCDTPENSADTVPCDTPENSADTAPRAADAPENSADIAPCDAGTPKKK